jgi:hypothetical protein
MKKQIIVLFSLIILSILLFISFFRLFQNDEIYHNTIGLLSQNYERTGGWNDYKISKVSKPYLKIENDNFSQWMLQYTIVLKKMVISRRIHVMERFEPHFFHFFLFCGK